VDWQGDEVGYREMQNVSSIGEIRIVVSEVTARYDSLRI